MFVELKPFICKKEPEIEKTSERWISFKLIMLSPYESRMYRNPPSELE